MAGRLSPKGHGSISHAEITSSIGQGAHGRKFAIRVMASRDGSRKTLKSNTVNTLSESSRPGVSTFPWNAHVSRTPMPKLRHPPHHRCPRLIDTEKEISDRRHVSSRADAGPSSGPTSPGGRESPYSLQYEREMKMLRRVRRGDKCKRGENVPRR